MTLRLRLVLTLLALVALAQVASLGGTYIVYRNSQYQRLQDQLQAAAPSVDSQLDALSNPFGFRLPPDQGRARSLPLGTFAEQITFAGTAVALPLIAQQAVPNLPDTVPVPPTNGRFFQVGATKGSVQFLVLERPARGGGVDLIAVPTTEVVNSLHRFALIEVGAVAGLLIVVTAGSWLVLRRGLRPLERMADTAAKISSGDLSQRVSPSDSDTEVGQLGLALNTMLADIEAAFAEREATEQKLRQFLADASHELRTPLTSIQGFAELFRVSGDQARVDLPTILRRIEEEAGRMKGLVEDLLLLARLDEHRVLDRRPVDLVILSADACTDAAAVAPDRRVVLDAPEPVVVEADEDHVRQAVGNLVANALKHTPAGTPLEVGCHLDGRTAVISVRDHGPGLAIESLPYVFDRFWQGDKARVGTGAGLGLSIVAAIAAEHGGRAAAANAEGGGALFTISLPGACRDAAACERTPSPHPT